ELERRQRADVTVAVRFLGPRHLRHDVIEAFAKARIAAGRELLCQRGEVMAQRVARDTPGLPATVALALRLEPRVLQRVVQQPVGLEAQQVLGVALARRLERAVQEAHVAELERPHREPRVRGLCRRAGDAASENDEQWPVQAHHRHCPLRTITFHDSGFSFARNFPPSSTAPSRSAGATSSGASTRLVALRWSWCSSLAASTANPLRNPRSSTSSASSSVAWRLSASTVVRPDAGSNVTLPSRHGRSSRPAAANVSVSTFARSTSPRAKRAAWANGWKIVWRQARPPVSVMIGPMTFTSCARQATFTRSARLIIVISAPPTMRASSKL